MLPRIGVSHVVTVFSQNFSFLYTSAIQMPATVVKKRRSSDLIEKFFCCLSCTENEGWCRKKKLQNIKNFLNWLFLKLWVPRKKNSFWRWKQKNVFHVNMNSCTSKKLCNWLFSRGNLGEQFWVSSREKLTSKNPLSFRFAPGYGFIEEFFEFSFFVEFFSLWQMLHVATW